jgi:hypothetical protein
MFNWLFPAKKGLRPVVRGLRDSWFNRFLPG